MQSLIIRYFEIELCKKSGDDNKENKKYLILPSWLHIPWDWDRGYSVTCFARRSILLISYIFLCEKLKENG